MVTQVMSTIENKAISAVSENEGDNAGKEGKINDSHGLVNEQLVTYHWDGNFFISDLPRNNSTEKHLSRPTT